MGASYQEALDTPTHIIYRDIEMIHMENIYRKPVDTKKTKEQM